MLEEECREVCAAKVNYNVIFLFHSFSKKNFFLTILANEKNIHRDSTEILNALAEEEWLALRKTDNREILESKSLIHSHSRYHPCV